MEVAADWHGLGEWDVMWVSHLCGSGRYVGFVPGGVGTQQACFVGI